MLARLLIVLIGLLLAPLMAFTHHTGAAAPGGQLNLGVEAFVPSNVVNVLKTAALSFSTASDVGKLDSEGYLTSAPAANVLLAFPGAGTMYSGVQYKLVWDAGVQFSALRFLNNISGCSAVNATFTGCTNSGSVVTSTGGAGSLTFTMPATQFSIDFDGGGTVSHTLGSVMALYRVSDQTDYQNGQIWTTEFRSALAALNLKTIRPMGMVQRGAANFNGETTWAVRVTPAQLTWGFSYPVASYGGTVSGTNTYTGGAASNTPGVWTDGEMYMGVFTNANSVSNPTININSRGAKTIVNKSGGALANGDIAASSINVLVYDAILDKVLLSPGGTPGSAPIEALIDLANRLNVNLWAILPPWATDNYATNWASTICSTLHSGLYPYFEYSNEIWNPGFPQTPWSTARGQAMGWAVGSNQAVYGWYGLRVRQVMGNLVPAACGSRPVRRVMAYQAGGDATNISNRFNGSQLNTSIGNSVYCTYTGGTFSGSCSGGQNYDSSPNRPIDVSEVLAIAPYAGGANLCTGPDLGCTPDATNAPFYQSLVTAWEGGQSATAITAIDNDIRQGTTLGQTVTASGTTFTTPLAHNFSNQFLIIFSVTGGTTYSGIKPNTPYSVTSTPSGTTFTIQPFVGGFPSGANVNAGSAGSGTTSVGADGFPGIAFLSGLWLQFAESNAALYDGARPAGMANVRVEWYEGNLEPVGLSAGQCTTLGITGSNCTGSIAAALIAWKNDNKSRLTQQAYWNAFMGTDSTFPATFGLMPHSKTPSQLVLQNVCGGSPSSAYSLLADCLPNSATFQTYNGVSGFVGVP